MAAKKKEDAKTVKFTKDQLLNAAVFNNRRDALAVVIKEGELLTVDEARVGLEKFMKGKVK